MSKIITLIATCVLLATTAIDGYAAPQASTSSSMQKVGPTVRWTVSYVYPAIGRLEYGWNYCVSGASLSSDIYFSLREVDTNGNEVRWVAQTAPGQFIAGPYYEPGYGWYDYCQATTTYDTLTSHGTLHEWIDLICGGWGCSGFVFENLAYPY